ncbi:hypothetical protein [Actinomadura opuntiae]|uniref:hypothetical protein n=1 Tax=Actinomadura sp. OS1-43 TaxID=604315 RepID=UPI00255ACE60|nr:hypothetical protein [Actinomadura sp. OS1-43]MDL4815989.1 hypothetical protein [Actinomadura sp. OS1-43]
MSTPTYEELLASARFFADRALRDYTNDDRRAVLMDAGTLLEHVSKALLIQTNPAYLVELKPGGFDHLLHLTGRGDRAPRLGSLRTIGANEAVTRVQKLVDIRTSKADLDDVLQVRNGIVHTGAFDETRTRQLLTACLRYCEEVYHDLGMDAPWGRHAHVVQTLLRQSWTDVQHEVYRKITAAKVRLRALMGQIPKSEQAAVAAGRQSVLHPLARRTVRTPTGQLYVAELVDCPVCTHAGALCLGHLREGVEWHKNSPHESEDPNIPAVWLQPEELHCHVCGVSFSNADEMQLAGVPPRLEIDGNVRAYLGGRVADFQVPDDFAEGSWTVD